jgi:hypothetical protein
LEVAAVDGTMVAKDGGTAWAVDTIHAVVIRNAIVVARHLHITNANVGRTIVHVTVERTMINAAVGKIMINANVAQTRRNGNFTMNIGSRKAKMHLMISLNGKMKALIKHNIKF